MEQPFAASAGNTVKAVTAGVVALFAVILALGLTMGNGLWPAIFIPVIFIVILGGCYYFSIRHYVVTDAEIIVKRPFDAVVFKRNLLTGVQRIEGKSLRFSVRTFGIGGVLAITGKFWNKRYGNMTWYVTRTDRLVMLEFGQKKVIVSPDSPDAFIAALKP